MPSPRLDANRRRALRLLAGAPDGYTEALMLAHRLPFPQRSDRRLVRQLIETEVVMIPVL